jgi:hypothetical protein
MGRFFCFARECQGKTKPCHHNKLITINLNINQAKQYVGLLEIKTPF